ncbi:MAG TPA: HigA family addiction module antitoxin [Acidobacteriota bacterium]|nr:HigA family addiction module antitoxin [Acidobacteriota bacterium]
MINQYKSDFSPDYAVHPGEILKDELEARGISQKEFAERVGASEKHISEIINAKAPISPEMSVKLETAMQTSAHIWMNLQCMFQAHEARIHENTKLSKFTEWMHNFPIDFMINNAWIEKSTDKLQQLKALLTFFGVASPRDWDVVWANIEAMYRKADDSDKYALSTWLRKGEIEALNLECRPYDETRFREILAAIRPLTGAEPAIFVPELKKACAACGVAIAFIPQTPGSKISGAARWLEPSKALIQLSLRYKKNDILWFTFFHEAAHLLLHRKKTIYLENEEETISKEEDEAIEFAANLLIPKREYRQFVARGIFSENSIIRFAEAQGISPAIVLGRLQKNDLIPWNSKLNKSLKMSLGWVRPKIN